MNNIWFPAAVVVVIVAACAMFWPFGLIDPPAPPPQKQFERADVEQNLKRDAPVFESLRARMVKAKGRVVVSEHWVHLDGDDHRIEQCTDAQLAEHGLDTSDLAALREGREQLGLVNITRDPDGVVFKYPQPNPWRIKWTDHIDAWSVMPDPAFKGR